MKNTKRICVNLGNLREKFQLIMINNQLSEEKEKFPIRDLGVKK